MSLQNDLKSADLAKLKKELDLREQTLAEKERLLDPATKQAELKVLDGRIKAKQKQLAGVETQIKRKIEEYGVTLFDQTENLNTVKDQAIVAQQRLSMIEAKRTQLEGTYGTEKLKLQEVLSQIQGNKRYLGEQEQIVATTVSDWNMQLRSFQTEADLMQQQRSVHATNIAHLETEVNLWEAKIEELEQKYDQLDERYQDKVSEYRADLQTAQNKLSEAGTQLDITLAKIKQAEQDLKTREDSVRVKEAALAQQAKSLEAKERKLKSDYAVAGWPF